MFRYPPNTSGCPIARQRGGKHSFARLCNNRGCYVFRARGNVTQRWMVVTWYVFPVMRVRSSAV
jgi:hypothetical protein